MNQDTLEILLIDRSLGQLSPEMEALLAEHLATRQEYGRIAAEFAETVALATGALRRPEPAMDLPPRVVVHFPPPRARRLVALVASFALGAGLALLAMRPTPPSAEPGPFARKTLQAPAPSITHRAVAPPTDVERAVRSLPFWSKERVYLLAESQRSKRPENSR